MKNLLRYIILLVIFPGSSLVFGQNKCRVLIPQIARHYEGGCKKGFANGKGVADGKDRYEGQFKKGLPDGEGTYYWSTGEIYKGDWVVGFRDGEGSYTYKIDGRDTTISGIWSKDVYKGPVPDKPKILFSTGVDHYSFHRYGKIKNRVLINIYQNGARNIEISSFRISSSSGYDTSRGGAIGYDNVTFPVTIKLNYITPNKLHTSTNYVTFEFTIYEEGDWVVDLQN